VHRRQTLSLAHIHPAIETEGAIERIERMIACDRIERVEFNGKPRGNSLAQYAAQMRQTGANGRRRASDAFREVPDRQPFLEELSAV
jgi:hypothetical protein